MSMSDPISDMLTRIRNANQMKHETCEMPSSKMKIEIAKILKREGFIRDFRYYKFQNKFNLKVFLKYGEKQARIIGGLKRISKPGCRVYVGKQALPKVLGGLGIAIMTTPQGIMTDKDARKAGIGGEIICHIW